MRRRPLQWNRVFRVGAFFWSPFAPWFSLALRNLFCATLSGMESRTGVRSCFSGARLGAGAGAVTRRLALGRFLQNSTGLHSEDIDSHHGQCLA